MQLLDFEPEQILLLLENSNINISTKYNILKDLFSFYVDIVFICFVQYNSN